MVLESGENLAGGVVTNLGGTKKPKKNKEHERVGSLIWKRHQATPSVVTSQRADFYIYIKKKKTAKANSA